jgi:hypothetical protein
MRSRHHLVFALAAVACSQGGPSAPVSVAPSLVFPQGILSEVSTISLDVYNTSSGVACTAATASSTGVPTGPSPLPATIAQTQLSMTGCTTPGATFCATLPLTESTTPLVFAAVGKGSMGNVVANGCTSVMVSQEAVTVTITMQRYIAPAMCGDGIVEVGETCDPGTGGDPLCMNCQTSEIELSPAATYAGGPSAPSPGGPTSSAQGVRGNPAFVWPAAGGDPGYLYTFFTDHIGNPSQAQVSMSVRGEAMAPETDVGGQPAQGGASLFLPDDPNTYPPQPDADDQSFPSAAVVGATYYVAFEDDNTAGDNGIDVHLRSMDSSLDPQQPLGGACGINGPTGTGEEGVQSNPKIAAGPNGVLFVVWWDQLQMHVSGVTYTPPASGSGCGTLGTEQVIGSGSAPALAATPIGWVVAWQNGSNVQWQAIGATGAPTGTAANVGTQSSQSLPAIAAGTDGGFAIAWVSPNSAGTNAIFAQRFSATQMPIAGDQTSQVNNLTMGAETTPAMAYTSAAGSAYVVAWVDAGSPNQVRARFLEETGGSLGDGSGYLFNTIDGQIDEFLVSVTPGRLRENPTVAVGGSGPYIAFGWEDQSPASGNSQPGIIGRRFPPPTE